MICVGDFTKDDFVQLFELIRLDLISNSENILVKARALLLLAKLSDSEVSKDDTDP